MAKRKNMMDMMDMTPACERCGKVAPVDEKLSTPNWTVYRTKEPCECGGKYTARAFLDDRVRYSCDKEANHYRNGDFYCSYGERKEGAE